MYLDTKKAHITTAHETVSILLFMITARSYVVHAIAYCVKVICQGEFSEDLKGRFLSFFAIRHSPQWRLCSGGLPDVPEVSINLDKQPMLLGQSIDLEERNKRQVGVGRGLGGVGRGLGEVGRWMVVYKF